MEYDRIKVEWETSATLKLLRSRNVALIVSFLYRQFKAAQKVAVPQLDLEEKLGDYLEFLQEVYPDLALKSPKDYLNDWCDAQLLRKTFDTSDEPIFSLTPAAEKAIAWLEDLQQPDEFIGTESRFLQIFSLLKEIQDRSTEDVETRIAQLEQDRDRIQQEINSIRESGIVKSYSQTQLQERFLLADKTTRQLIADFRAVEQNFRNLTRKVQEAQLEKDSRRGSVVGRVLDADEELKESDQGRSFYAFFEFLMSDIKREELKAMIQAVYQLEELRPLTQDYGLLRRIERSLLDAANYIVQSNHRLTEKLRQMLDERNLRENQRVAGLITEVCRMALQMAETAPSASAFWTLEGDPELQLVMERPLHPLEASETPTFSEIGFTEDSAADLEETFTEIFQQFHVDERFLIDRIDLMLEDRPAISLTELIELHPVTQGLPEVVAYLSIASQSERHSINASTIDSVTISGLEPAIQLQLKLPHIIFYR